MLKYSKKLMREYFPFFVVLPPSLKIYSVVTNSEIIDQYCLHLLILLTLVSIVYTFVKFRFEITGSYLVLMCCKGS